MRLVNNSIITVISVLFYILPSVAISETTPRIIPENELLYSGQAYFNSANHQAIIESNDNLSHLAEAQSHLGRESEAFGFTAISDEAKYFIIGTLYSEALAHLKGENLDLAAERLGAIEKHFIDLQVPSSLYNYISKIHSRVSMKKYSVEVLMDILSFFQPFFEDFAQGLSEDKLILFRAGSWLVDMSLTVSANNQNLIKQSKPQLKYFIKEMARMDAPKGVLNAYNKIDNIVNKEKVSDNEVKKILKQVKKIQTILG